MEKFRIIAVGQDVAKIVAEKIQLVGINKVNQVSSGMLGNLKTLTYEIDLEEDEVIKVRQRLMGKMAEDNLRLMPMCVHGDWMRVFVFKPMHT